VLLASHPELAQGRHQHHRRRDQSATAWRPSNGGARGSRATASHSARASPNDVWCADFKGHFALLDRSRCYPLTVGDAASRFLLKCEGLRITDEAHVRVHFERAFTEFGLAARIRTDNGPPFATARSRGLSKLAVWWVQLGITPERIEPGHPEQNGRHERMHRTLARRRLGPLPESACSAEDVRLVSSAVQRAASPLSPRTEAARVGLHVLAAPMPTTMACPEYGPDQVVRLVDSSGDPLAQPAAWPSATSWSDNRRSSLHCRRSMEVRYGPLVLGILDERRKEPRLVA